MSDDAGVMPPDSVREAARAYLAVRDGQPLELQDGYEGWLNRMDEVEDRLRAALEPD